MIEFSVFQNCMVSLYSYLGVDSRNYNFAGLYELMKRLSTDELNKTLKVIATQRGMRTVNGESGVKFTPTSKDFNDAIGKVLSKTRRKCDSSNINFDCGV
jgi:hypothetical protein